MPVIHYCRSICSIFTTCIWYLIKDVGLSSSYLCKNIYKYRSILWTCHWFSLYGLLLVNISLKYVESTVNCALNLSINQQNQQYNLRPLQSETAASRQDCRLQFEHAHESRNNLSTMTISDRHTGLLSWFIKEVWLFKLVFSSCFTAFEYPDS